MMSPCMLFYCCCVLPTVVCARYVNRLAAGVRRHAPSSSGIRFLCFTDDTVGLADGVETAPLPPAGGELKGWWFKSYLFSPEATELIGLEKTAL